MTISALDQLIIDTATDVVASAGVDPKVLVVLDDPDGALAAWARDWLCEATGEERTIVCASRDFAQVARFEDDARSDGLEGRVRSLQSMGIVPHEGMLEELFAGIEGPAIAIGRLPKSLSQLDVVSRALARAGVTALVAGENNKHMTRSMNGVLEEAWGSVRASRGRGKFRCLIGELPKEDVAPATPVVRNTDQGEIHGFGGVFSGAVPDYGGELLAKAFLEDGVNSAESLRVLDLGSGNGTVSLRVLAELENAHVIAVDIDADAVASTRATLAQYVEAGQAELIWDDGGKSLAPASFDVVLLNPPFHDGNRVDATLVDDLVVAAQRLVRADGSLYLVHNSHLRYRPLLERIFGGARELTRNSKFTVLRADKR